MERAVAEFALEPDEVVPVSEARLRRVSERGAPLVIVTGAGGMVGSNVPAEFPDTSFAFIDWQGEPAPNVAYTRFRGGAGHLPGRRRGRPQDADGDHRVHPGGVDTPLIWKFQAGFEAGARHVDPDSEVHSVYLSRPPDMSGFSSPTLGAQAAGEIYRAGADVIYHAAGAAGFGLLETAVAESRAQGRHPWAVGVDHRRARQRGRRTVGIRPGDWRPHILTSSA